MIFVWFVSGLLLALIGMVQIIWGLLRMVVYLAALILYAGVVGFAILIAAVTWLVNRHQSSHTS